MYAEDDQPLQLAKPSCICLKVWRSPATVNKPQNRYGPEPVKKSEKENAHFLFRYVGGCEWLKTRILRGHYHVLYHVQSFSVILCVATLEGNKVSILTHTYPHKPLRNIKVTIYNHQADRQLYVWPDVLSGDLQV